jgi:isopenicillin N synthase-like dioxygenase
MSGLIPTIDLSGWADGDPAVRSRIAAEVDAGCQEVGFLQIFGHGIDPDLLERMLGVVDRLFELPMDTKMKYQPVSPDVNNGYSPVGAESLAYSLGVEDAPPDLFEAFNVGPEDMDLNDPAVIAEIDRIFAPNLWPVELPELQGIAMEYFTAVRAFAHRLTSVFAVALGMDETFFEQFCRHSTDTLRINHFQRTPTMGDPLPGQTRMGAHTDYGIVTVLYGDPVPGLEIVDPDGSWCPVIPEPGSYVINIGDLLAQWTNDRWRSTVHRVAAPPVGDTAHNRRRSMAFFHDGDWDAIIECLPTCCDEGNPARYEPVRALDHLMNKLLGGRTMSAAEPTDHIGDRIDAVRS